MESHGVGNVYRSALTVLGDDDGDPGEVTGAHDGTPGTRIPHRWMTPTEQSSLDLTTGHWTLLSQRANWPESPVRVIDPRADFAAATGIGAGGALLIRPDGFISWRAKNDATNAEEELRHALDTIGSLVPAAPSSPASY